MPLLNQHSSDLSPLKSSEISKKLLNFRDTIDIIAIYFINDRFVLLNLNSYLMHSYSIRRSIQNKLFRFHLSLPYYFYFVACLKRAYVQTEIHVRSVKIRAQAGTQGSGGRISKKDTFACICQARLKN